MQKKGKIKTCIQKGSIQIKDNSLNTSPCVLNRRTEIPHSNNMCLYWTSVGGMSILRQDWWWNVRSKLGKRDQIPGSKLGNSIPGCVRVVCSLPAFRPSLWNHFYIIPKIRFEAKYKLFYFFLFSFYKDQNKKFIEIVSSIFFFSV